MRKETFSDTFTIWKWTPLRSWCWIRTDAAEIRDVLRAGPPAVDPGPDVLWQTKRKTVLRLKSASGLDLAYKWCVDIRWLPYGFSWTQAMKEAYNFKRLAHLGLPLVKLVAVGEERGFFSIRNCFLVTEYADGFLDGRHFFESFSHETGMRDEFTRENFRLIARLHDAGFFHGGFTPMNELWRKLPEPDAEGNRLDIRWIDIATCSRAWGQKLKRLIAEDLGNFLRFYSFTEEERREHLRVYLEAAKVKRFDLDSLCRAVEEELVDRGRRKQARDAKKAKKNKATS